MHDEVRPEGAAQPLVGRGDRRLQEVPALAGQRGDLTKRMNVEAAAERLFVHKNTVRYRLSRTEELLGHPLAERAALVELALRHVAVFGPPVRGD